MFDAPKSENPAERRIGTDRRKKTGFPRLFSSYRRRRSKGRRKEDKTGYVDVYDLRCWGIALSVLILSLLDAVLTGLQLQSGMVHEANPIMNAAIRLGGIYSFISLKAALTSLPLAIIILHKEWTLAKYAARLCLWAYVLIAAYHGYLIIGCRSLTRIA